MADDSDDHDSGVIGYCADLVLAAVAKVLDAL